MSNGGLSNLHLLGKGRSEGCTAVGMVSRVRKVANVVRTKNVDRNWESLRDLYSLINI